MIKAHIEKLRQYAVMKLPLAAYYCARKTIWQIRGLFRLAQIRRREGDIYLELGAGCKPGTGHWVTIDINGACDIYFNLARGIPFADESVSRIYSSHMFEHLSPVEAQRCLKDCLRVLKPGGECSLAVPDARIYVDAYWHGDQTGILPRAETPMDYLNYVAYCGGVHKTMFDQESLCHLLRSSGFVKVKPRDFDSSVDSEIRRRDSIYAMGYKGGCTSSLK